ncbi:MAG: histidine phosphatase family protein [Georgenia sp.]
MRLILVRHGQTPSNVGGLLDTGAPGPGLTELGREQAAAAVHTLRGERVEAIFASVLVRTQETAAPLAGALGQGIEVREGIREIAAGDLEMRGDRTSVERYLRTILGWTEGDLHARLPGGETGAEVFDRFDAVVEEIAGLDVGTAVAFSHGAAIRAWTAVRAANVSTAHIAANPIGNTGAVVLEGHPRTGWHAVAWEGRAVGGPSVDAPTSAGPVGEPVEPRG